MAIVGRVVSVVLVYGIIVKATLHAFHVLSEQSSASSRLLNL